MVIFVAMMLCAFWGIDKKYEYVQKSVACIERKLHFFLFFDEYSVNSTKMLERQPDCLEPRVHGKVVLVCFQYAYADIMALQ